MMQDIEQTVFGIIAAKAKVDRGAISRATDLTGLGLDSVDTIEAIFEIEETFDISLIFNANRAASDVLTAGDVVDLVAAHLSARDKRPTC